MTLLRTILFVLLSLATAAPACCCSGEPAAAPVSDCCGGGKDDGKNVPLACGCNLKDTKHLEKQAVLPDAPQPGLLPLASTRDFAPVSIEWKRANPDSPDPITPRQRLALLRRLRI